jgi:hypothetical protein
MSQVTPEPGGVPPVPPRPQQPLADPIMEALRTTVRPQLQHGFPAEAKTQQPQYQPSPMVPQHMLQQPSTMLPNGIAFDGALGSLMSAVLNQKRDVDSKFYMLLIPESAPPVTHAFDAVEELRTAIKGHLGTSTYIFCFLGHALKITKGPFHFLQTPYGAVPLHDIPAPTEQDSLTDGWVGPELPITEFIRQSVAADEVTDNEEDAIDDEEYVEGEETEGDVPHDDTELF